jgi:hypothetical protein
VGDNYLKSSEWHKDKVSFGSIGKYYAKYEVRYNIKLCRDNDDKFPNYHCYAYLKKIEEKTIIVPRSKLRLRQEGNATVIINRSDNTVSPTGDVGVCKFYSTFRFGGYKPVMATCLA